jgi:hypothetical protein
MPALCVELQGISRDLADQLRKFADLVREFQAARFLIAMAFGATSIAPLRTE